MTNPAASDISVRDAIHQIQRQVNNDDALIDRGRFVNVTMMLVADEQQWLLKIIEGRVASVQSGPFVMPDYAFKLSAPEAEWQKFWQPVPPPGSQDLFALLKRRVLQLDGDLHALMSNLFYFKFALAAPRSRDQAVSPDADAYA